MRAAIGLHAHPYDSLDVQNGRRDLLSFFLVDLWHAYHSRVLVFDSKGRESVCLSFSGLEEPCCLLVGTVAGRVAALVRALLSDALGRLLVAAALHEHVLVVENRKERRNAIRQAAGNKDSEARE